MLFNHHASINWYDVQNRFHHRKLNKLLHIFEWTWVGFHLGSEMVEINKHAEERSKKNTVIHRNGPSRLFTHLWNV